MSYVTCPVVLKPAGSAPHSDRPSTSSSSTAWQVSYDAVNGTIVLSAAEVVFEKPQSSAVDDLFAPVDEDVLFNEF